MEKKFKIDFFELSFLAEACIPPCKDVAETAFWKRLTFEIRDELTLKQRVKLLEWLQRNDKFNLTLMSCREFHSKYSGFVIDDDDVPEPDPELHINFTELKILAGACIPPRPIARTFFFNSVINEIYARLSTTEKAEMLDYITKHPAFNIQNEHCKTFFHRYHPKQQATITATDRKDYECFLMDGKYYTYCNPGSRSVYIPAENIQKINKG
jgi:hypothetical protein